MSGIDAAATLSLKIDTDSAAKSLEKLEQKYSKLRSELGQNISLGGIDSSVKNLQAGLSAVAGALVQTNHALDDIKKQGGGNLKAVSDAAKSAAASMMTLADATKANIGAAQASSNAATAKLLRERAEAATLAAAAETRLAQASAASISAAQASSNAATAKLLRERAEAATLAAAAETRLAQASAASISAAQASSNAAAAKLLRERAEAATLAAAAETRLAQASAASISAAQASSNAAAAKLLRERAEAATLAAAAETRLAQASAASISAAQASSNAAAAKLLRERAEAATLAADAELRLAAATRANTSAAKVAYSSNIQKIVSDRSTVSSGKPVSTYNSLMNSVTDVSPEPVSQLTNAHKTLAPAIKQSADHQLHWNKIANEGHAAVRGLSGSLGTLWITYGSLVPLLAGAALGSAFVNAAKAGSEFSYQLTFVKALGNESAEAIERLSSSALALSQTGLRGPTEIASGYRILAQAGLDAAAALEVMPHVLNLSTVGEMEMEQAATTLVGVMTAFNLKVEDAGHVGDVFAKAAALSQTSVQSMTEAMKYASVVGEQYGASLEDSAAALTLLAKVNITGTSAGTAYRNMLKELFTPVPQAAKAMNKLGLETRDANGNLKSFVDIMNDLREKLKDFSQGDTLSITQRIFGERGGKEAARMLAIEKADWDKLVASIKDSNGFMEGVTAKLNNEVKGKWAQALNTLQVQLITAFKEMEPAFSELADNFKQLFSDPSFVSGLKSIVGGVASLTSTLVSMASVLLTGVQIWAVYKAAVIGAAVWTSLSTAVSGFAASMLAVNGIMGPALGTMATLRGVIGGLPSLLMAIPTPLTIIAGALAAGATAWAIWGGAASRAGDMAYDSARRAEGALAKVKRREKYGVGDLGEAQEELDKAEKLLNLRVEGRATGTALSDARQSVGKWTEVVADLEKEKYKAANASSGLKAAVEGKPATRKALEILGADPKPGRGGSTKVRDYSGDLEKSNITSLVERQQENIKVLDLVHKNHLISEDQYQSQLAGIYAEWGPKIENEYKESISRLAKLQAASSGDEAKQYEKKRVDLETAYRKFQFDEAYRSADALAAEKGRIKKTADELDKIISEQVTNTKEMLDNLEASRLKLDMTPVEAAGYDAGRAARKTMNKPIADLQAQRQSAKDAGYADDSELIKSLVAEIEKAIDAQNRLGESAASVAKKEAEFAREYATGWKSAYKEWADNATNAAKMASDSFVIATNAMESALDTFLTTGKINFAEFAKSVILGIAKIEARALLAQQTEGMGGFSGIVGSILKLVGMGGGGVSGGTVAGVMVNGVAGGPLSGAGLHEGGIAGLESTFLRTVPASTFLGAPKFHQGGIAGDEVPAILKRGEGVFTQKQMRALSGKAANSSPINITVHVNGNSNAPDVRRAAGQGAREALSLMNGARRYG